MAKLQKVCKYFLQKGSTTFPDRFVKSCPPDRPVSPDLRSSADSATSMTKPYFRADAKKTRQEEYYSSAPKNASESQRAQTSPTNDLCRSMCGRAAVAADGRCSSTVPQRRSEVTFLRKVTVVPSVAPTSPSAPGASGIYTSPGSTKRIQKLVPYILLANRFCYETVFAACQQHLVPS